MESAKIIATIEVYRHYGAGHPIYYMFRGKRYGDTSGLEYDLRKFISGELGRGSAGVGAQLELPL